MKTYLDAFLSMETQKMRQIVMDCDDANIEQSTFESEKVIKSIGMIRL